MVLILQVAFWCCPCWWYTCYLNLGCFGDESLCACCGFSLVFVHYMFSDRVIRRLCWRQSPCLCLCPNNWSCKCSFIGSVAAYKWNQGLFVKHCTYVPPFIVQPPFLWLGCFIYESSSADVFFSQCSPSPYIFWIYGSFPLWECIITVSPVQRKSKLNHMELHLCSFH